MDIRTQTIDLMGQQAITKDNISVIIDAVVFMRI
ncbi:MAG: SPFH domain-containing protein, partial [Candidatus Bathyarchaeia archaeon]